MCKYGISIGLLFIGLATVSCRQEEGGLQRMEQVIHFYIQNPQGGDLLNPNDSLGYANRVNFVDLNADRLDVQIGEVTPQIDEGGKNYLEYTAGATRVLVDSVKDQKKYISDFVIKYQNREGDTKSMSNDTLHVAYLWSPSIFRISEILLNRKKITEPTVGSPSKVVITK
ncbi:hypothetical protein GNY06_12830 [Elizabethkingia argentiflava]|uniref:Lipoprotein n=1 Tax=Elizabethkingia argenteiflava TaxID=2681556 RepID=A0A845PVH6_9FLAO|nr:hypothetical protein [Elizabethkingia argenteiflava]NAW52222.1 hypothetical protein [Elizabethkingia argenteiflava]